MQLIWFVGAVEIIIIRQFFYAIFSSILIFFNHVSHIDFLNFLTVFRLTTCAHDFEFVIACLSVVMKTIKTIDDLIELKFEKFVDLNISWFDNFIWNDLMQLIVCDFLRFCAVFVVSNLMADLDWFLMIIFNLIWLLTIRYLYQFLQFSCFHRKFDWFDWQSIICENFRS